MANYEFAVTTQYSGKVKNPQEVVNVFQALGYEESYVQSNGDVFIGGYNNPLDDSQGVITPALIGEKRRVVVENYCDEYVDVETGETLDSDIFDNEDGEFDHERFAYDTPFEYLQSQLLDGEVFALSEGGWEKLRSAGGTAVVVSKDSIDWNSTYGFIEETIKKIRGEK